MKFIKKQWLYIVVFYLYMFTYMTVLTTLNTKASGFIENELQISLYYIDSFAVSFGFASYYFYNRLSKSDKLPLAVCIIYIVLMAAVMFATSRSAFIVIEPFLSFFNGLLGGFIYYFMAMNLYQKKDMGMIMAIGNSLAIIIQVTIQIFLKASAEIVLLIDMLCIVILIILNSRMTIASDNNKGEIRKADLIDLLIPCAIVICLNIINTYFDSLIEILMVNSDFSEYNIYSWPRLFSCVGFMVFGYVHDHYFGKYDGVVVLFAALLFIVNPIIITLRTYLTLGMCLFYISLGIYISYFNISFWDLASKSDKPALWASMGRIIDSLMMVILVVLHINEINLAGIIIIDVVTVMIIFVLLFRDIFTSENKEIKMDLQETKVRFDLTERELEVYKLLVESEDSVQEIADKLYISRRTLQRHISSIYKKFDVTTRSGLIHKSFKQK